MHRKHRFRPCTRPCKFGTEPRRKEEPLESTSDLTEILMIFEDFEVFIQVCRYANSTPGKIIEFCLVELRNYVQKRYRCTENIVSDPMDARANLEPSLDETHEKRSR